MKLSNTNEFVFRRNPLKLFNYEDELTFKILFDMMFIPSYLIFKPIEYTNTEDMFFPSKPYSPLNLYEEE